MQKQICIAILCLMTLTATAEQIAIEFIETMPCLPKPYEMRDWKQVTKDLDAFLFDFNKKGEHLPLIWLDPRKHDFNVPTFALPAYVGHYAKATNAWDTITCLGAVSSATLVGINKSNQNESNWVAMCQNYFSKSNGQNLYLNNVPGTTGGSFWYELFPNILFYRIYHHYPGIGEMDSHFTVVADRLYDACVKMGGCEQPYATPDFNHTAFNFLTMQPYDNGVWKEADSAAAIAWLEYMAYVKTGNKKYLTAAKWSMDYLQNSKTNPYYECLFPHGTFIAARMNAERGTSYDVKRMINWCFDGSNWRKWGISQGKWGQYDCAGLCSSMAGEGYAFLMNTFNLAGNLVPLVRYDDRFARAIGKWMLNAANNSRLFYSYALDQVHQTDYEWSKKYDPTSCIAYEGLQDVEKIFDRVSQEKTLQGKIESGTLKDTIFSDGKYEVLAAENKNGLTHIWTIPVRSTEKQVLVVKARATQGQIYQFSYRHNNKEWKPIFTLNSDNDTTLWSELAGGKGLIQLKIESEKSITGQVFIDDIYIRGQGEVAPFATGDPRDLGWGATNLGLYGSVFVGIFGGIINTTYVEGILQIDCLATDYFGDKAYPTYLYYNPYASAKEITINVGSERKDLYNTVTNEFIAKQIEGSAAFSLAADTAAVIVIVPSDGKLTSDGTKTLVNDIIIDYRK